MEHAPDNRSYRTSGNEQVSPWWGAGSLLFGLLAAAPLLLNPGFLNTRTGGDSPFLLFRLHQLYTALSDGVFPVRWMPDAAFGLGYPFFNYYAALPFYFAAGLRAIGFSYVPCLKLTHLAGFLVASWAMFAWIRRATHNKYAALLSSAAYTFAPYHIVNVYVRGDSLVEFWAMAWFPLILLTLHEAAHRPTPRRLALVALAYGALAMTHNISALIFSPFVVVYGLGCALARQPHATPRQGRARRIALLAGAGILGLALAAWVWLPALGEQKYAQLAEQTTGYFFYGNHFRAANLVQRSLFFNYDEGDPGASPFSMGLIQAALTTSGVAVLIWHATRNKTRWHAVFVLSGLALSTLMITPLSEPIWATVPLLPFTQFPWRFFSVQALFCAAAIASLTPGELPAFPPPRPTPTPTEKRDTPARAVSLLILPAGLTALLAAAALGALNPNFIPLTDADVTPQHLQWYESFSGNIGTTIRYEYLPIWTQPRPYTSDILLDRPPRAKFMTGGGTAQRVEARAASQLWAFDVEGETARVALPLLYWPGWRAAIVDGPPLPVTPLVGLGYVLLDMPGGSYHLRLWLGRTPLRLGAELCSLAALVALIALWRPRVPRLERREWAIAAAGLAALVALMVTLRTIPTPQTDGPLTADFAQEAYFHPGPHGLELPDAISTISAPPQQLERGGPLLQVETAETIPPGLYFPVYPYPDQVPLTASGEKRGTVYLSPLIVDPYSGEPPPPPLDHDFDIARLLSLSAHDEAGQLSLTLWWQSLREAAHNYAIALRLLDDSGEEWAALDTQAGGAGMYPTGLWHPGEIIPDAYRLDLTPGTPPGAYTLRVTLYETTLSAVAGQANLEGVTVSHVSQVPCDQSSLTPLYGEIAFSRITMPDTLVEGEPLAVSVDWLLCEAARQPYTLRWTLAGPTGRIYYEAETPLAPGSDPTAWQPAGDMAALVQGRHHLDLPRDLPPGAYALSLQLLAADGEPLGQPLVVGGLTLLARQRSFDVPPLDHPLVVTFGQQLKLWGYTLRQEAGSLELDVAWGALSDPTADYKFFVHLFDPSTEHIVAQLDAMPRGYSYPTSLWAAGEVVSERLSLDVRAVPPGSYRLALGWYDPLSADRLVAVGADGTPLPGGRVILDEAIVLP